MAASNRYTVQSVGSFFEEDWNLFESHSHFTYILHRLSWRKKGLVGDAAIALGGTLQGFVGHVLLVERAAGLDSLRRAAVANDAYQCPAWFLHFHHLRILFVSSFLCYCFGAPSLLLRYSLDTPSVVLRYLSATWSLFVRYLSGSKPDIYRRSIAVLTHINAD